MSREPSPMRIQTGVEGFAIEIPQADARESPIEADAWLEK